MFIQDYAIFLGKEEEHHFIDFIADSKFFMIVEVKNPSALPDIQNVVEEIKTAIADQKPNSLQSFSDCIEKQVKEIQEGDALSLACGLEVDDILYLKTVGGGQVFIARENNFSSIIEDPHIASGFIRDGDTFIFTTARFTRLADRENLSKEFKGRSPKEIVDELTPQLKGKDDAGAIALFVRFIKPHSDSIENDLGDQDKEASDEKDGKQNQLFHRIKLQLVRLQQTSTRGRKITFIAVFFLLAVLVWSVMLGAERRQRTKLIEKIEKSQSEIEEKLNQAEEVSIIDRAAAMRILTQANDDVVELRESVGDKEADRISRLKKLVQEATEAIVQKDDKRAEEFYDLKLIAEGAIGESFFKVGDEMIILDSSNGALYKLSLQKKSAAVIKNANIKGANHTALYKDFLFFFNPPTGIFKIDADGKVKKAIEGGGEWKQAVDFSVFNGNIYVLDSGADEVYKYLVTEKGYSNKTSYFKQGQSIDLQGAVAMAVDGSVYIAVENTVYKYLSGDRQTFSIDVPSASAAEFADIFTDADTSKVYLLDKKNGLIYVISKDGEYEKQLSSSVFKSADDFIVYDVEKSILVLVKDKIYRVKFD